GPLELAPMRDPLTGEMKQWDDVVARQQQAIERTHRRNEAVAILGLERRLDHRVDRLALHAGIVERAFGACGLAPPAKRLLVPGGERDRPVILDHVEIVGLLAPLILRRVNLTDSRIDSYLFQGRGIGDEKPLLSAGRR